jgi:hypothetical protein
MLADEVRMFFECLGEGKKQDALGEEGGGSGKELIVRKDQPRTGGGDALGALEEFVVEGGRHWARGREVLKVDGLEVGKAPGLLATGGLGKGLVKLGGGALLIAEPCGQVSAGGGGVLE